MLFKKNRIFLSPPHLGAFEQQFVKEAFESNYIAPLGPQVDAFEKEFSEYTGIQHCVAVSSGTAAMHLALRELGVGQGDSVVGSSLTFIGSISPVVFLGADLIFVDSDRRSWNMDPNLLAEALKSLERRGKLPKAVIPTDLYGQCSDYHKIFDICDFYGVSVIIDAAEAMGATYFGDNPKETITSSRFIHAGKGAKAAVFSFNGNKILTTSGGGMLASDDGELIDRVRFLSQQARDPFPHYEHSEIGFNYRMSNILAGIGRGQLRALDDRINQKKRIFKYYQDHLKDVQGIEFIPEVDYGTGNKWLTVILISPETFGADRETVRLSLEEENIESRPIWKPMHMQPVFRALGKGNCLQDKGGMTYPVCVFGGEVSEDLFNRGLCLPSGTAMTESDMDRIIEVILRCQA